MRGDGRAQSEGAASPSAGGTASVPVQCRAVPCAVLCCAELPCGCCAARLEGLGQHLRLEHAAPPRLVLHALDACDTRRPITSRACSSDYLRAPCRTAEPRDQFESCVTRRRSRRRTPRTGARRSDCRCGRRGARWPAAPPTCRVRDRWGLNGKHAYAARECLCVAGRGCGGGHRCVGSSTVPLHSAGW